jgi:C1A family cysteine protease
MYRRVVKKNPQKKVADSVPLVGAEKKGQLIETKDQVIDTEKNKDQVIDAEKNREQAVDAEKNREQVVDAEKNKEQRIDAEKNKEQVISAEKSNDHDPKDEITSLVPDTGNPHPSFDELPKEYRERRYNYQFIRNGHKGTAHPLKNQKLDFRKFEAKLKTSLPTSYSLQGYVSKVLDQGSIGACTAHSAVQAIHMLMNKLDKNRYMLSKMLTSSQKFYGSRLYVYDNARFVDGTPLTEDAGSTNLSTCKGIEQFKICPEEMWPYNEDNLRRRPSHDCYVTAATHTTFEYSVLDQNINDIKYALASGCPVMIGIVVYPSFINSGLDGRPGDSPIPHNQERENGGHSILLVGYNDDTRRVTFVNSWTANWGTNGFGTLPYEYLEDENLAGDFIAIEKFI